ncbi:hypothetical protein BC332_02531 [Capsicum chinense]|nr:hypothetical protein BC332_02531 [Capsicum chinense]
MPASKSASMLVSCHHLRLASVDAMPVPCHITAAHMPSQQQFSVGVNEITRVLERMPPVPANDRSSLSLKMHSTRLQVILVASDCHPRLLTKHLESLANSKNVPVVFVKDKKRGSLRLGELIKLKTAIAIGVKDKGNQFNQFIGTEILHKFE